MQYSVNFLQDYRIEITSHSTKDNLCGKFKLSNHATNLGRNLMLKIKDHKLGSKQSISTYIDSPILFSRAELRHFWEAFLDTEFLVLIFFKRNLPLERMQKGVCTHSPFIK